MRVWDIHPGYLSKNRLLGQHAEIHAVFSIISKEKQGYANHPETKRWKYYMDTLVDFHDIAAVEMKLRGFNHHSPLATFYESHKQNIILPQNHIDPINQQFVLLKGKYTSEERGRIPLPKRESQLWAHYKYSIMARGYQHYKDIKTLMGKSTDLPIGESEELVQTIHSLLKQNINEKDLINTLQHLWGYFKNICTTEEKAHYMETITTKPLALNAFLFHLAKKYNEIYLLESTFFADTPVYYR